MQTREQRGLPPTAAQQLAGAAVTPLAFRDMAGVD